MDGSGTKEPEVALKRGVSRKLQVPKISFGPFGEIDFDMLLSWTPTLTTRFEFFRRRDALERDNTC